MNVKAAVAGVALSVAMFGAVAIPASANPADYLANPGRIQAGEVGAQCDSGAGSGAFQFFGPDDNMAGGAEGYQTGINNSALCGNRPAS